MNKCNAVELVLFGGRFILLYSTLISSSKLKVNQTFSIIRLGPIMFSSWRFSNILIKLAVLSWVALSDLILSRLSSSALSAASVSNLWSACLWLLSLMHRYINRIIKAAPMIMIPMIWSILSSSILVSEIK